MWLDNPCAAPLLRKCHRIPYHLQIGVIQKDRFTIFKSSEFFVRMEGVKERRHLTSLLEIMFLLKQYKVVIFRYWPVVAG